MRIHLAVAALAVLLAAPSSSANARVPESCKSLFVKAGEKNDLMLRRFDKTREIIDGDLEYVRGRTHPASRIRLGKLADEFAQRFGDATALLRSVEEAFRCAAPATPECRPLYSLVAADKLQVERRLQATSDYLMSFSSSYWDTLATRREIVRFAEYYTLVLEAQLRHQQSTLEAVRCVTPQQ